MRVQLDDDYFQGSDGNGGVYGNISAGISSYDEKSLVCLLSMKSKQAKRRRTENLMPSAGPTYIVYSEK